jgi:hypothetical protein
VDDSPQGRSSHLGAGRALLAAGKSGAACRQTWKPVHEAVKRADRQPLAQVARLARAISGVSDGKQEQAHVLLRYVEACLEDLE